VADPNDISQFITEVATDQSDAQLSQFIAEVSAAASAGQLSQSIIEAAAQASGVQISQLTIELLRGPEVIPPTDTPVGTFTFDEGLGNDYFLLLQLSDIREERRDHCVKSFLTTGKRSNVKVKIYGKGPLEDINVDDMEEGVNSNTGPIIVNDCAQVQRSKRYQVNVPNSMVSTLRYEGMWNGTGERDRIDEIVIELAEQGIRR
jgi:hypothetical protein